MNHREIVVFGCIVILVMTALGCWIGIMKSVSGEPPTTWSNVGVMFSVFGIALAVLSGCFTYVAVVASLVQRWMQTR